MDNYYVIKQNEFSGMWYAQLDDFINIHESPVGVADTPLEALKKLMDQI